MDYSRQAEYRIQPNLEFSDFHLKKRLQVKKFVNSYIVSDLDQWYDSGSFPIRDLFKHFSERVLNADEIVSLDRNELLILRLVIAEELSKINCPSIALAIISHFNVICEIVISNNKKLLDLVELSLSGSIIFSNTLVAESSKDNDVFLTIRKKGNRFIVNGTVQRLINSEHADYHYVTVSSKEGGAVISESILLPTGSEGMRLIRRHEITDSELVTSNDLFVNNAIIENLIIVEKYLVDSELSNRIDLYKNLLSSICVSTSEYQVNETIDWCKERTTFEKPIMDNQWVQFKFAEAMTQIELCRQLVYGSLRGIMEKNVSNNGASRAKFAANELIKYISELVTHYHGVHGYLNTDPSSKLYRFGRLFQTIGISNEKLLDEIMAIEGM